MGAHYFYRLLSVAFFRCELGLFTLRGIPFLPFPGSKCPGRASGQSSPQCFRLKRIIRGSGLITEHTFDNLLRTCFQSCHPRCTTVLRSWLRYLIIVYCYRYPSNYDRASQLDCYLMRQETDIYPGTPGRAPSPRVPDSQKAMPIVPEPLRWLPCN